MPCEKILSLLRPTKDSNSDPIGDGFKLTTLDVQDLLACNSPHFASQAHTVSAICTMDNVQPHHMDPPRGKGHDTLATISGLVNNTFVMDYAQLLTPQESQHGGFVEGRMVDPVTCVIVGLHSRYAPLEEGSRLTAKTEI